jgi:acetoin utilization protein AcuB
MRHRTVPTVADVMTPNPVTISPSNSLRTAKRLMEEGNFRRLPVVEGGRLVGIVTDRDLRLALNSPLVLRDKWYDSYLLDHMSVEACMTPDPVTIGPDASLEEAIRLILERKFSGLPVVKESQVIGIVTVTDLLQFLLGILSEQNDGGER